MVLCNNLQVHISSTKEIFLFCFVIASLTRFYRTFSMETRITRNKFNANNESFKALDVLLVFR